MIAAKAASHIERITMIADATGRQVTVLIIDSIDFEGDEIDRSQIALKVELLLSPVEMSLATK